MIVQETYLLVKDNSGINYAKCIKVLGISKKKYANVGDMIKVAVNKKYKRNKKKLKSNMYFAIVISVNKKIQRKNGIFIKAKNNSIICLSLDTRLKIYKFLGNKIRLRLLRELGHYKKKINKFPIFFRRKNI
jgi:large subunit ribosomal protein L14